MSESESEYEVIRELHRKLDAAHCVPPPAPVSTEEEFGARLDELLAYVNADRVGNLLSRASIARTLLEPGTFKEGGGLRWTWVDAATLSTDPTRSAWSSIALVVLTDGEARVAAYLRAEDTRAPLRIGVLSDPAVGKVELGVRSRPPAVSEWSEIDGLRASSGMAERWARLEQERRT